MPVGTLLLTDPERSSDKALIGAILATTGGSDVRHNSHRGRCQLPPGWLALQPEPAEGQGRSRGLALDLGWTHL